MKTEPRILEEEKKLFNARVDEYFQFLIKDFGSRDNISSFPGDLLKEEIEKIRHLFTGNPRLPRHRRLEELYNSHVQGAIPVYDRGDQDFETWVEIYAKMKFIEYLKRDERKKSINKLTLRQIALKYVWENKTITRENANDIAIQFGHNSGQKLYTYFNYYSNLSNRKGNPGTVKKLQNKISLFKSVIPELKSGKQKASEELKTLDKILETESI